MTKLELEKSLKEGFRKKKKRLEDKWESERAKWSLGVGTALVIGMAIGRAARYG